MLVMDRLTQTACVCRWEMQRPEGAWMSAKTRNVYRVDEEWAGRLLFAGEGCSIDGHQCVHGAFETGQNQARTVLQLRAWESGASGTRRGSGGRRAMRRRS